MREGGRRKETRLRQTFTTKGWTDLSLAGLVWLHLICFGQTILDPLVRRLCVVDLAVSCSRPLGSVVVSAGPAQYRGPEDQHDVAQDGRAVFREIGEARASEASRTKEVTTLTAKQHFPSHAHTSTAVKENNSVFHRSLLCKTHKKIPDNEMH